MQGLGEKILIADDQLMTDLRFDPDTIAMTNGFRVLNINQIPNTNCQVKTHGQLVPLKQFGTGHLIKSEFYFDRYYPLVEHAEKSSDELLYLMSLITSFMGENVHFIHEYKQTSIKNGKESHDFGWKAGANYTGQNFMFDGGASYNRNQDESHSQSQKNMRYNEMITKGKAKSPQELKQWLQRECVNVEALPPVFRAMVRTYLEGNKPSYFDYVEHTMHHTQNSVRDCLNFRSKLNVCMIFKAKFGINLEDKFSDDFTYISKIRYAVKFS